MVVVVTAVGFVFVFVFVSNGYPLASWVRASADPSLYVFGVGLGLPWDAVFYCSASSS